MKPTTNLPVILITGLFLFILISCNSVSWKTSTQDYLISQQDTARFAISTDSIGVVIKEGTDEEQLKKLLAPEGYIVARNIQKEIFIIVPDKKKGLNRGEIFDIAKKLVTQFKDVILHAGYLAYPQNGPLPVIVTDEVIVDFTDQSSNTEITKFLDDNSMEQAMQNPFIKTQYLVRLKDNAKGDALVVSRKLSNDKQVKYIHPNFVVLKDYRAIPDDPLFSEQWHHRNTGSAGGTADADIDTDLAWDFGFGNPATIIAIIDGGFDMTHPDITPNFSINTGETDGNGIDDDGNGFIDDRIGWDFDGCTGLPCGDAVPEPDDHGTAVIGTAAARGRNTIGVIGSCSECGVIPIESGHTVFEDAVSFGYARARGAKIISCSWGYTAGMPRTMAVETAINNTVAAGVTVFFAMPNRDRPYCFLVEYDIAALPSVIAVSRSTNTDKYDEGGYGDCMDILAPSAYCTTIPAGRGTLWATTTDRQGADGYNNTSPGSATCLCPHAETGDLDYTRCFSGTSFSTPLSAGVAGLILSADNTLTPRQVQYLLQDCADKIEHSQGEYSSATGFSSPASGTAKHGYGRINAFEATRVAAPIAVSGKAGIDIFLRDNSLDWGNTEQPSNTLFEPLRGFIPHWESVDIKVDAPPFATAPATSIAFDAFVDERPKGGMTNKVYVRVHNRGYRPAATVNIKLHWVYAGLTFPPLPSDFWSAFPADPSDITVWHPLGTQTILNLAYSGASVGGTATDASQVAAFAFAAPVHDETLPNHYCLMALIDSPDDRLVTPFISARLNMDNVTPYTNNATHRNITVMNMAEGREFSEMFHMTNPYKFPITAKISVLNPYKINYRFDDPKVEQWITLQAGERRLIKLQLDAKGLQSNGELRVQQVREINGNGGSVSEVMGGITFSFVNKK